ncbi:hypothetical protein ACWEGQ_10335 [Streptomyces seoulensis]
MDAPLHQGLPRFAIEPEAVITEFVLAADPACADIDIPAALADAFRRRPQLRELAEVRTNSSPSWRNGSPRLSPVSRTRPSDGFFART